MSDPHLISITVNGVRHETVVEARRSLADVLRHDLGLTGTHIGCEHGICGTCTVLVEGRPARSCLMFGVQADDLHVETVESLAENGELNRLQQAFADAHGLQCGFCTPGFLMLTVNALERNPRISDEELLDLLSSNLCRCTGYQNIIKAVKAVRDEMAAAK